MRNNIKNNLKKIAIAFTILVYSTFKYLSIELQIIIPVSLGVFLIIYAIYMSKQRQPLAEVIVLIILSILGILTGIGHYVSAFLNDDYCDKIIPIVMIALIDLAIIVKLISEYNNGNKEKAKKIFLPLIFFIIITICSLIIFL